MPELPDVENYRRYLDAKALHKKIDHVEVGNTKILRGVSRKKLASALEGRKLEKSRRHGKQLFARLDNGEWLTLHFGMTGYLAYFEDMDDEPRHDRLRVDFSNRHHLAFANQRMFGGAGLTPDPDRFIERKKLGPDALDIDRKAFRELLNGRGGQIKSALMDQQLIAGIGNVYSDEILFHARLHPKTAAGKLQAKQVDSLYRAMRRVLETAIDRGAGTEEVTRRVPKSWLLPHRKDGARCPRCAGKVATMKAAGRTAYYCPSCQKQPGK